MANVSDDPDVLWMVGWALDQPYRLTPVNRLQLGIGADQQSRSGVDDDVGEPLRRRLGRAYKLLAVSEYLDRHRPAVHCDDEYDANVGFSPAQKMPTIDFGRT
jgi:hypothetical protein